MSIRYNVLNLPGTIQFSNGHQISNRYTADGIKHMSTYHTALTTVAIPLGSVCQWVNNPQLVERTRTYYCGNTEYEESGTGIASLQRIGFGNGYIRNNTYYYTITDYLGNISSVWNGTSNLVEQQTTYYPSGLPHRTSTNANLQRYKYNGKELITNHGYDQYDYHARGYYPAIMRFTSVDPLAEADYETGMYVYCGNNPIIRIDPDGRFWNYVIGGAIGAGVDYASQVAVNLVEGKGIKESLTQVDGKSIMVSAVAGATGVGLASLTQKATTVYKLGSASSKVVNASTSVLSDAAISAGSQYAKDGKVSAKNVVVDVVAGQAGRGAGNTAKANAQSSQTGVSYQKQANRATGKAMHNPNTAKSTRAEAAKAKANNYGSKTETAVSSATSNTISSINENSKKNKEEKRR